MTGKIFAPFTADQVDALNVFQRLGYIHPFTCPGHEGGGDRDLIATRGGWICCHCDYRQDWAHVGMLNPPADPTAALATPAPQPAALVDTFSAQACDIPCQPEFGRIDDPALACSVRTSNAKAFSSECEDQVSDSAKFRNLYLLDLDHCVGSPAMKMALRNVSGSSFCSVKAC
jgi:hypothetical protein